MRATYLAIANRQKTRCDTFVFLILFCNLYMVLCYATDDGDVTGFGIIALGGPNNKRTFGRRMAHGIFMRGPEIMVIGFDVIDRMQIEDIFCIRHILKDEARVT